MSNPITDNLFHLIKALEKSEKRFFKLYVTRNSSAEDSKIIQLFDALDRMDKYQDELLFKKCPKIKREHLPNVKLLLYKKILTCLRLLRINDNIETQLNEQMDYARILFDKGLYLQSLRVLEKLKDIAKNNNQLTYVFQALHFEKHIESLYITRSFEERADILAREGEEISNTLKRAEKLSSLSLQLYSFYIKNGFSRNIKESNAFKAFFESRLPSIEGGTLGFYDKLFLYQSFTWFAFIRQDFLMFYRYSLKGADLFEQNPEMIIHETSHFIKSMHNLLSAHFILRNTSKFTAVLEKFETFAISPHFKKNENIRIQTFAYLNVAKINKHFIEGTFNEGVEMIPTVEERLLSFSSRIDRHRILIFYYKFACLHFGNGNNKKAIYYLNKIIQWKVDLRTDLQCYARLLSLLAHFELGNYDLLEYLLKSIYRFMAKMKNLSLLEKEIFSFIRKSFDLSIPEIKQAFIELKSNLDIHKTNPYETRSYMYLDIISWLESKIKGVPVAEIIREKYLKQK